MSIASDILAKALLPTHLNSAEMRALVEAEIRRRSLFTARCAERAFLGPLQEACADFASGKINHATAREKLRAVLDDLGYDPMAGGWADDPHNDGLPIANELEDLSSTRRLDLILRTQRDMARSVARLKAETDEHRAMFPAWRLTRVVNPGKGIGRDWQERWRQAANEVDWEGVAAGDLVALKGSPIWQALGDGAGGYDDTLENHYPPFAFNSGMMWTDVSRAVCLAYDLDPDDATGTPATLTPGRKEMREAAQRFGRDFMAELIAELQEEGPQWS